MRTIKPPTPKIAWYSSISHLNHPKYHATYPEADDGSRRAVRLERCPEAKSNQDQRPPEVHARTIALQDDNGYASDNPKGPDGERKAEPVHATCFVSVTHVEAQFLNIPACAGESPLHACK